MNGLEIIENYKEAREMAAFEEEEEEEEEEDRQHIFSVIDAFIAKRKIQSIL